MLGIRMGIAMAFNKFQNERLKLWGWLRLPRGGELGHIIRWG